MKKYKIIDGLQGEAVIPEDMWPKVVEMSDKEEKLALKAGLTKEQAALYRWKIVEEIESSEK